MAFLFHFFSHQGNPGAALKQNAIIIILWHPLHFSFNFVDLLTFLLFFLYSSPKVWLWKNHFISIYLDRGSACIFAGTDPEGSENLGTGVLVGFPCCFLDFAVPIYPYPLQCPPPLLPTPSPVVLRGLTSSLSQAQVQGEPPGPSLKDPYPAAFWNIGIRNGNQAVELAFKRMGKCLQISAPRFLSQVRGL